MRIVMKQFCDSEVRHKQGRVSHSEAGLTLIEMLIVLVIIAIIAGMVVMSGCLLYTSPSPRD